VNTAGASVEFAARIGLIMTVVGFGLAVVFLRVVDTRARMPIFFVGAACYVLSTLIPAVLGVSLTTLLIWQILGAIGGAFAFEAILKVWTQESFPTLLRSTAQGTIYGVARFATAGFNVVTPALIILNPQAVYIVVSAIALVGFLVGWIGFRRGTGTVFDTEDQTVPLTAATPAVIATA
jgi:inositol transporter-like SP family MFS transporter